MDVTPENPDSVAAFIAAAEDDSRARLGRSLTREELTKVLRRYALENLQGGW